MLIGSVGKAVCVAIQTIKGYINARNERIAAEEELKKQQQLQQLREVKKALQTQKEVIADIERQKQRDLMRDDIRRMTRKAGYYLKIV